MCNAYSLAHYGLPLKRTKEVLLEGDIGDQVHALKELSDTMNDQLMELAARKTHIESELRSLGEFLQDPLACHIVDNANLCILPIHNQEIEPTDCFSDSPKWWEHAPLVNAGMLIEIDKDWNLTSLFHGPVAYQADVARLQLPADAAVRFDGPGRRFLHAYITLKIEELPYPHTFAHIARYLQTNHLTMSGHSILTRLLRYSDSGEAGAPTRCDEVFVPLV